MMGMSNDKSTSMRCSGPGMDIGGDLRPCEMGVRSGIVESLTSPVQKQDARSSERGSHG